MPAVRLSLAFLCHPQIPTYLHLANVNNTKCTACKMLRRYRLARTLLPRLTHSNRGLSSSSSSGGTAVAVGAAIIVGGAAATVGAASQFPSFRKSVEQNVPPVKTLFDYILSPLDTGNDIDFGKNERLKTSKKPENLYEAPMKEVRRRTEAAADKNVLVATPPPDMNETVPASDMPKNVAEKSPKAINKETAAEPSTFSEVVPSSPENTSSELPVVEEIIIPVHKDNAQPSEKVSDKSTNVETVDVPIPTLNDDIAESSLKESEPTHVFTTRTPEQVESKLVELEEDQMANDAAMSAILDDTLSACASRCSDAIESSNEAAEAISLHTSLLKSAMNDGKDASDENNEKWTDISRVLEQKSRLQTEAESLANDARQELAKLEEVVAQLKQSTSDSVNRKILQVEETCNEMRKELDEAVRNINIKLSESHVISEYKDLVDTAKEQFRQELMSIVPDVKLESGWRKLSQKSSNEDLNALIAHAHRRVDQLQRELAEERAIAVHRIANAVKTAREKWEETSALEMENKIQVIKRQTEIEHNKKIADVQQDFENEMRIQLKRQTAAHSDHLAEVLGIQEREIKDKLEKELYDKLAEQEKIFSEQMEDIKEKYDNDIQQISEQFQFDLNKALAKVAGIETAIDGRAYVENESRKAQELWLACEALRIALQYGDAGKPAPLQKELQAIHNVPGVETHVKDIVNSFPTAASERGVFTEDALRSAYKQVAKICRRVSLINETRNTFFDYILSYLKSLLIISRAQTEPPADLDIDNLDTFSILSYATFCLENGDLEQATRFVNQLTGESRRVAEGWLEEARLLLETRQIVEVLSSMATATTIAANMEM